MNTTFAVWMGPDRQATEFTVHPVGCYRRHGVAISPYLPLAFAEAVALWCEARFQPEQGERALPSPTKLQRMVKQFIISRFPQIGPTRQWRWPILEWEGFEPYDWVDDRRSRLRPTSSEFHDAVCQTLAGRRYTGEEVAQALIEQGVVIDSAIDAALEDLVHQDAITRVAGVQWLVDAPNEWRCRRCHSTEIGFYPCYRCGLDLCPQCDTCMSLGRVTACTSLYFREATGSQTQPEKVSVKLSFTLTPHQQRISRDLAQEKGDALVWAACGAGKTEVTYETIRQTLAQGGRVLFAVPRRDVVEQLGRRLSDVFSDTEVASLYGGTPHRYTKAPLVVATVHQTLRFYRAFHLAVIDEVDAFPLNREPWLLDALERSLIPESRWIAMTATPSPAILNQSQRPDCSMHVLPARPHGHPLPLPEIVTSSTVKNIATSSAQDGTWTRALGRLLEESVKERRRVLVFVPSVALGTTVAGSLKRAFGYMRIESVHAGDAQRSEKVAMMEEDALDVLVSTTVLERGITLPHLDVIVFAADTESVWDAASLIQMAGRVGRSPSDPTGRVVFFASRTTPAMREACRTIEELNKTARELGLISATKSRDGAHEELDAGMHGGT